MKDEELTPGVYRLTEDVINPHRDKRMRADGSNVEIFHKGMWFIYTEFHQRIGQNDDIPWIDRRLTIYGTYGEINPPSKYGDSRRWEAIVPKLERVPESIRSWLAFRWPSRSQSIPARDILEKLGAMRRLTLKDIQEAHAEVERDWEEEYDREKALREAANLKGA